MSEIIFAGCLLDGERVLWSGEARQGLMVNRLDIMLIPLSVIWCGFAIVWEAGVLADGAPAIFPLFGSIFVVVGLYLLIGRFIIDAGVRRGLRYAVTDRRILIARPAPFSRFTALNLRQLPTISLEKHWDRRGTIRFDTASAIWSLLMFGHGFSIWTPALSAIPQFMAITDARRVFDLIQRARMRP